MAIGISSSVLKKDMGWQVPASTIVPCSGFTITKLHVNIPQTLQFCKNESQPKGRCYPHRFFCLVTFMSLLLEKRAGPYAIEQSYD